MKTITVAIDGASQQEAMYVNGDRVLEADTVYACDIAEHCENELIQFRHINVDLPNETWEHWPLTLTEVEQYREEE